MAEPSRNLVLQGGDTRDVITRGIFTSVADLRRKLLRYIRLYSKSAKPFKWKYNDVRRRIVPR